MKDLQLTYITYVTYVNVFPDSTYLFNTFPEITNMGFYLLAHAWSHCGGGPEPSGGHLSASFG